MPNAAHKPRKHSLTIYLGLLKKAFLKLVHNDPLRMAGATAFFTSFALPFILIILIQVLGLFYDKDTIRSQLYQSLSGIFGSGSMQEVVNILIAFRHLATNWMIMVLGIAFLFMVSTTLLMVIKTSINQLWRIRIIHGRSFMRKLRTRMQSVLIIAGTGILFFLSVLAEGLKAHLDTSINSLSPAFAYYFTSMLNYLLSVLFVTLWFSIIFRLLPDARVRWRIALTGAFVTSILFNIGKYLLRILLVNSNINNLYGASAGIVLLLLFVFYSSLIMYYGVAFTRIWADHMHAAIKPLPYATQYKLSTINEAE